MSRVDLDRTNRSRDSVDFWISDNSYRRTNKYINKWHEKVDLVTLCCCLAEGRGGGMVSLAIESRIHTCSGFTTRELKPHSRGEFPRHYAHRQIKHVQRIIFPGPCYTTFEKSLGPHASPRIAWGNAAGEERALSDQSVGWWCVHQPDRPLLLRVSPTGTVDAKQGNLGKQPVSSLSADTTTITWAGTFPERVICSSLF